MINRGSEWHKWDLHVHTPNSLVQHYTSGTCGDVWEQYISDLERLPKEIKVLGINDYLFIDGYKKVLEYKQKGRLANIDLILPVIEFRLDKFGGHKEFKRINFHVIFSNEVPVDIIQNQFLNLLSSHYKLSPEHEDITWGGAITKENLSELGRLIKQSVPADRLGDFDDDLMEGFNNLNLKYDEVVGILREAPQFFKGKYLTAIGKTEWDAISWNDQSIAEKKTIINSAHFVFTASESIEAYQRGREKLVESRVNSLLLDCSDAHHNLDTTEKDRLGNCNTWIKAQLSFEGLKQVLYEPSERLRVQINEPDEKNVYQVIDTIQLQEDGFWKGDIPLNKNLNTIIGGRSTGKSTLLKGIVAKIDLTKLQSEDTFATLHKDGLSITWCDGETAIRRDIEYFRQSYMYQIASNVQLTNQIVEDIIRHKDQNQTLEVYDKSVADIQRYMSENVFSLFQKQKRVNALKQTLLEKGNREGVEQQLTILFERLAKLQRYSTLTDEEKKQYDQLENALVDQYKLIRIIRADLVILQGAEHVSPFNSKFFEDTHLNDLQIEENLDDLRKTHHSFVEKAEASWVALIRAYIDKLENKKKQVEEEILTINSNPVYVKGKAAFQGNNEILVIQKQIEEEQKKLSEIDKLIKEKEGLQTSVENEIKELAFLHASVKSLAEKTATDLVFGYDGLQVGVELFYHSDDMYSFLSDRLNLRSTDRQEYIKQLTKKYSSDAEGCAMDFLRKLLFDAIILKSGHEATNVATEFLSRNWYSMNYKLTYQSDAFEDMSEGKQAFVILKLLLDFSDKKCPILIDQPEDSLDNRAIYNELVAYLKKKKRDRQIILVTHNSNVVVSADAENVIVANQEGINAKNADGNKFQYINGALEETKDKDIAEELILLSQGIREHVCEILEGGKDAFMKREKKYGFR